MQTQAQKPFLGYGIVYPDGTQGIKVKKTHKEAPIKNYNPDGSVSFSEAPPTIHELVNGSFVYESGKPVKVREHLLHIPGDMGKRALLWFDSGGGGVTKEVLAPSREPEKEKVEPDPSWVVSDGIKFDEKGEIIGEVPKPHIAETSNEISALTDAVKSLVDVVSKQAKDIEELKKRPVINPLKESRKKQAESMKAKWADPDYKKKRLEKIAEKKNVGTSDQKVS